MSKFPDMTPIVPVLPFMDSGLWRFGCSVFLFTVTTCVEQSF